MLLLGDPKGPSTMISSGLSGAILTMVLMSVLSLGILRPLWALKCSYSLLVQWPTPLMWTLKWFGSSGAELMVNGCHSNDAIFGIYKVIEMKLNFFPALP